MSKENNILKILTLFVKKPLISYLHLNSNLFQDLTLGGWTLSTGGVENVENH